MTQEKLKFSRQLLILGNLALLGWILLAFISVLLYNQIYGYLYLVATAFIVYAILRRLGCSSCYNCQECTSGFGRMAGAFFGKGVVKKGSVGNRLGLIAFIYFLLIPFPIALLVVTLVATFSWVGMLVLASLLAVAIYSLASWFTGSQTK
ncbi:MAG: hypothetical protein NWE98_00790 [Candidatus Bathyarchaeota archaeon]|nr:hypothetical protein [Candidatus Bathyarchaeota archaeon]